MPTTSSTSSTNYGQHSHVVRSTRISHARLTHHAKSTTHVPSTQEHIPTTQTITKHVTNPTQVPTKCHNPHITLGQQITSLKFPQTTIHTTNHSTHTQTTTDKIATNYNRPIQPFPMRSYRPTQAKITQRSYPQSVTWSEYLNALLKAPVL